MLDVLPKKKRLYKVKRFCFHMHCEPEEPLDTHETKQNKKENSFHLFFETSFPNYSRWKETCETILDLLS